MPIDLSSDRLETLIRDIRNGDYNLLIGAGTSYGGVNSRGEPLPLSEEFRIELCDLKGARGSTSLQRVFETLDDCEIDRHVVQRFSGCKPSKALNSLPSFIWKRIFTLNVDDALEAAYESANRYQDPRPLNFRDPFEENRSKTDVPIIHLHGWVKNPSQGFVFSREDYIRQARKHNPWMVVLAQYLSTEPFVIMGTSLDEFDLSYYLSMRTSASVRTDRGPSILVEMEDDVVTRNDCEKYNLTLFTGHSLDFIDYLNHLVDGRTTPVKMVEAAKEALFPSAVTSKQAAKFFVDFERIPSIAGPSFEDARFMFGREPSWSDLAARLDVSREQASIITAEIDELLSKGPLKPTIVYLHDVSGAGKSTILRRIGYDFAQRGVCALICSATSEIEPDFTTHMLDLIDVPLLLVVDNFALHASVIGEIVSRVEKRDLVVLATERSYRNRYVMQKIVSSPSRQRTGRSLTAREINSLISNYTDAGFLGINLKDLERPTLVNDLRADPVAVACCRIMNDFRPLDGIIDSLISETSPLDLTRYLTASLAHHCMSGGLRHEILVSVSPGFSLRGQLSPIHPLALASSQGAGDEYLLPLNRTLAARCLRRVAVAQPDRILTVMSDLAKAISPRVHRQAIKRRSPEARLAGRLFDFDEVVYEFLKEQSIDFYKKVHSEWKWNSRYWEQLSLLNLSNFQNNRDEEALDAAVRHARHAVSIERHPLTLTTLGKVLLAQMPSPQISPVAVFHEAFTKLIDAISLERRWQRANAQPYIVFLRGIREFQELGYDLDSKQRQSAADVISYARSTFQSDLDVMTSLSSTVIR